MLLFTFLDMFINVTFVIGKVKLPMPLSNVSVTPILSICLETAVFIGKFFFTENKFESFVYINLLICNLPKIKEKI